MHGGRTRLRNYSAQSLFAVAPGDVIDAEVYQDTSGGWDYYVSDLTSGSSSSTESFSGLGTSAEWIAEDPGDPTTGEPLPLADFGSVTFTDLGLTVPSGSWTLPPYSDAIEMVAPDGSVEALPSPIQGSGASAAFTVTYETPGQMSSTAGTAVYEARPVDIRGARAANRSATSSTSTRRSIDSRPENGNYNHDILACY
jgi:hypothetical protein